MWGGECGNLRQYQLEGLSASLPLQAEPTTHHRPNREGGRGGEREGEREGERRERVRERVRERGGRE